MRKWGIIITFIIIFIIAIFVGVYLYNTDSKIDTNNISQQVTNKTIITEVDYSVRNDITIKTNVSEEKISPNATLILKKQYKECGHTIKDYKVIPEELVNLTEKEVQEKYKEWEIEQFSSLEIILIKQEAGVCDEHYILKEKDGVIAIYKINEKGEEILEEETGVTVEYLTEEDKIEIQNGIKVYGKEELNGILEDYE